MMSVFSNRFYYYVVIFIVCLLVSMEIMKNSQPVTSEALVTQSIKIQDLYNKCRTTLELFIDDLAYVSDDDSIVGKLETYKYTTYALHFKIKINYEYGVLDLSIGDRIYHDISVDEMLRIIMWYRGPKD